LALDDNPKRKKIMTHFNESVTVEVQTKLKEFSENVLENFISKFREGFGCSRIDNIYGIASSGYIPLQKGGYMISEFYSNDIDKSNHFTKKQTEFNAQCYESFLTEYKRDNSIDEIDYDDVDFQNAESEYFEPCALEVRIWIKKDDMVILNVSVNYRDAPYYRFKIAETIIEKSMTIDEFMKLDDSYLIALKKMVESAK
jgi:hypothetical protein